MILFLNEQIGVPQGAPSVVETLTHLTSYLQDFFCGGILNVMKKPASIRAAESQSSDTFTRALASVLSASPKQIQESHDEAKKGKFSSHTRYKYVPAKHS
jgi:hypothetical protein